MPRKKKNPNEMTDAELLRQVFPERVAREIEREVGLRNIEEETEERDHDSDSDPSDNHIL